MVVILGNQLFPPRHLPDAASTTVFMAEDMGLCTYERHHQQKIVLFLAAMRAYADELRDAGFTVLYEALDPADPRTYENKLAAAIESTGASKLVHFEVEDKPMEQRLIEFAAASGLSRTELASPMFLCSRCEFERYLGERSRLQMGDFYRQQRIRLDVLVDKAGRPSGGRWSFDADNRKKLPKKIELPKVPWAEVDDRVQEVIALVEDQFAAHPGNAAEFCWPTTRQLARDWLHQFIDERLANFGPYEDALTTRSETVFHSALSSCLNIGLLTPDEVLAEVLDRAEDAPLQSIEGFVRQLIGWREFVRGVYRHFSDRQDSANFWSHERELADSWYDATTGIPPLDDTIQTALRRGWTHHIPRLMVLGNLMTLCEIRPQSAHRWFMEMYVDSSEWVMGPNVYGMGLFSDGGVFATKPYICGSNYLLKMSDYARGEWCDVVDGLYWRFIGKHREFFASNPRLAIMVRALDRIDAARRERISAAARQFIDTHTR